MKANRKSIGMEQTAALCSREGMREKKYYESSVCRLFWSLECAMIDEMRVLRAAGFRPCHCDRNCPLNYDGKKEKFRVQKANCGAGRTRDGYFERLCHYRLVEGRG
ncbi:hypothetical protein CEXT_192021 [Caerostris extrusa]|uniref:Uncharacterized protein n=1 Tax=Caerostris extrusa TaxID=172846 RepID=A0AAV4UWK0_CAEEX|nr:hypothetical protein CEXT_192021 [Caerostris extrusa]